ncbi:MAG: hypothetical protein PHT99_04880 [Methanoregula sp.]|nr:hypothetical protein [Methanoregula sp.]
MNTPPIDRFGTAVMHRPEIRSCASEVIPPGSKLVNPIPDAVPGILRSKTRVFQRTNLPAREGQQCCPVPSHTV